LRCRAAAAAAPPFVGWLVVALLSAVRFRHRMPSCDHQRSRCRPLSPINCLPPPPPPPPPLPPGRQAATTTTATTMVELTVVNWRRKRDDLLVDKAGTKTCYYSSGGALVASRRLPLQRFAMVGCCVLC
jgi:hypothetical protein